MYHVIVQQTDLRDIRFLSVMCMNDISISENIIKQSAEMYRKIRNTIRFLLSNLSDYQHQNIDLEGIHLLINEKLNNLKIIVKENYDNYQFINIIKNINNFIIDLS